LPRLDAGLPELLVGGILSMLLLCALGVGWSMAIPGLGPIEAIAVAPGIGLAILVIDGLILDLIGARIGGPAAVAAVLVAVLMSAILATRHRRFTDAPVGPV
jgi:predicted transporter